MHTMYFERKSVVDKVERSLFLLQTVLPAFASGTNGFLSLYTSRIGWFSAFDEFKEAVIMVNTEGQTEYVNKSGEDFLADDPERELLKSFLRNLTSNLLDTLHSKKSRTSELSLPLSTLKTKVALYRAEVFFLPEESLGKLYLIIRVFRTTIGLLVSMAQKFNLSSRELEVAEVLIQGHTNKEIAEHLYISEFTVRRHVESIFRKLGISSRAAVLPTLLRDS